MKLGYVFGRDMRVAKPHKDCILLRQRDRILQCFTHILRGEERNWWEGRKRERYLDLLARISM